MKRRESVDANREYRRLPAVDRLLQQPPMTRLVAQYGSPLVVETLRRLLDEAREAITRGEPAPDTPAWPELLAHRLAQTLAPSLQPVINATGVIVHTNLGRAPLSRAARDAVARLAVGYSNLEYDLQEGRRGSRYEHSRRSLCALSGAEDALVVNNNAAAVLLVLAGLCAGREVVVSRGQLVEIGGGFRIPDVMNQSGARLVEVGTTNRTHPADFTAAMGEMTGALMRIHASNFRLIGFTAMPTLGELVQIAAAGNPTASSRPLVIDDLGSGSFLDTTRFGLSPEPLVPESIAQGADIVTFSGDKLLGGPQAGIIVGRADLLSVLRRHPLLRAMRVDKMTLAALDGTLESYRTGRALQEIPVWQMIGADLESLDRRVLRWLSQVQEFAPHARVQPGESTVGGGSLPGESLPTRLLALPCRHPDQVAAALRRAAPPLICRVQQESLLLDTRTVLPEQDPIVPAALETALGSDPG